MNVYLSTYDFLFVPTDQRPGNDCKSDDSSKQMAEQKVVKREKAAVKTEASAQPQPVSQDNPRPKSMITSLRHAVKKCKK